MLRFADVRLGESGIHRCGRCHHDSVELLRGTSEIIADVVQASESWTTGPGPNIALTGAEPFRHPSLRQVVSAAVQAGAVRIRLDSDCHGLVSPDTARDVIAAGVRHLRSTALGPDAHTHDSLAASPGAYELTMRGVQTFLEAAHESETRVNVTARIPVCQHNLTRIPACVTAAKEAGASAVLLSVEDTRLDLHHAAPWLEAACDTGIVNALWVLVEGVPYGMAIGWQLHLASLYYPVTGEKHERCKKCPLDPVCSGAMPGASPKVLDGFRQPANAEHLAECALRGFEPLGLQRSHV